MKLEYEAPEVEIIEVEEELNTIAVSSTENQLPFAP